MKLKPIETGETFTCDCKGTTRVMSEEYVYHACRRPSLSYGRDGVSILYKRSRYATGPYHWHVDWK